jgi:hypothetical protein
VPITIEPEAFFDWCTARNLPINTDSAETFAYERQMGAKRLERQREHAEAVERVARRRTI